MLQVQNLDGKMQWLTDFKGKVVLLNFWSTTCPPCRVETPWFVEFQKRWEKDGFTVVGVSMDDTADAIRKFNAQFGVNYPMLAGRDVEENIQKATGGIWGMPTSFLIGRDGKVLKKHLGLTLEGLAREGNQRGAWSNRALKASNAGVGPFHCRSSTVSKTGMFVRRVARSRNSNASSRSFSSVIDSAPGRATFTPQRPPVLRNQLEVLELREHR